MHKKRILRNLIISVFILTIFVSCFSDKVKEANIEVQADAYVIKRMVSNEPAYAVTFYVYANQLLSRATATQIGGSGEKITLTQNEKSLFTMSKIPQQTDFVPYQPATADYKFDIIAQNGANVERADFLSYNDIDIPVFTSLEFVGNDKYLEIKWNDISENDGFLIKILNANGEEIFNSGGLESDETNYTLNVVLGNWVVNPNPEETYTVELHAYKYEPEAVVTEQVYNMQEISIAAQNILWK